MKRSIYYVNSYDGKITKTYRNYGCAVNFYNKLARDGIVCGIFVWNDRTLEFEFIIGY